MIDHIHLDEEENYLYGSTRKHIGAGLDYQNQGNMIYFWKVELSDDTYLIDAAGDTVVQKLDSCPSTTLTTSYCYVTGIGNSLRGDD